MSILTREAILARATRRRRAEPSAVLGGDVLLQELSRLDYRAAAQAATIPDTDRINLDVWHAAIVACGAIDEAGQPLFTLDEILDWRQDVPLWDELARLAGIILTLSEVGGDHLTKSDSPPDARRRDRSRGRQRGERGAAAGAGPADEGHGRPDGHGSD